jgi:hypothetical protein
MVPAIDAFEGAAVTHELVNLPAGRFVVCFSGGAGDHFTASNWQLHSDRDVAFVDPTIGTCTKDDVLDQFADAELVKMSESWDVAVRATILRFEHKESINPGSSDMSAFLGYLESVGIIAAGRANEIIAACVAEVLTYALPAVQKLTLVEDLHYFSTVESHVDISVDWPGGRGMLKRSAHFHSMDRSAVLSYVVASDQSILALDFAPNGEIPSLADGPEVSYTLPDLPPGKFVLSFTSGGGEAEELVWTSGWYLYRF